jgi:PAS domain S-box-containing protein
MAHSPNPDQGPQPGVDRSAIRAAGAFALVGLAWVVLTDIVLLRSGDAWATTWPRSANRATFVIAASAVVFLLVRRYGRQWARADASARQSDDALRRSEARYRSLVESVPGVVWLNEVDRDDPNMTHCMYVGPQLMDLLGYTPNEWMADDLLWRQVIHPEDLPGVLEENRAADERGALSMEYRAFRRGGGIVWIHDEAVLIPAEGDRPACWQGVMVDITTQRVQDQALDELTQSLSGLFQAAPLAILVLEVDGRVRHWNPAAERMFGWAAAEVMGKPLPYVPPDKLDEHAELRDRTLRGDVVAGFETTRTRRDGTRIEVSLSTGALVDADGGVTGLLGVVDDVTDRRRAEEERRLALELQRRLAARLELLHEIDRDVLASERIDEVAARALERLRRLVPYDGGSVAMLDPATRRFTTVAVAGSGGLLASLESPDEAARELLSRDALIGDLDELEGMTLFEGASGIGIRSVILASLHAGGSQVGTLSLTSKTVNAFEQEAFDIAREVGAELAIAISQARLRRAASERAHELARVAEERQQMLHRIVRAQEEERERVALELHDGLGQILTSISLFASDLYEEVEDRTKPNARRVNELARRAIADSRQLVWSLRPPELERLGLVPALRRLVDSISMPELTVDLLADIGDARLEPDSEAVVYRVVQEAVHNAQKHSGASAISILLQRLDGQLTTLVEDNGHGFDPAAVPHGRGFGLIGMRERAELVRGRLDVESAREAGTRVRLLVPIGATPIGKAEGAGE